MFAQDVRTIIKQLNITPDLVKTISCPACFCLYSTTDVPSNCTFKAVKGAKKCDEPLFKSRTNFQAISDKGAFHLKPYRLDPKKLLISVQVPKSTYTTQTLLSWVTWFLNKRESEEEIEAWKITVGQKSIDFVEDIQQTPAWKNLKWLSATSPAEPPPLHLAMNLFIDWFNPMGNKQAGKSHSMGLIALNCMNLPPNTRNLLRNFCIAGITPGTHELSVSNINNVLAPIVDQLLLLDQGVRVCTHQYPNGRTVQIKLLGLVGDVVGTHKVAGYASHSATCFCSYCVCKVQDRPSLQLEREQTDIEVRAQAQTYAQATTITKQEGLVRKFGVRSSELNRLPYRDTVKHVVLGVMHNWLEGVLQHHWRYRWGFKGKKAQDGGGDLDDDDTEMSGEESNGWDSDFDMQHQTQATLFSERERLDFNNFLQDVVLPSGIDRVPLNLGEARHGKLKASQWKTIFVYLIPLIIPQMLVLDVDDFPKTSNRSLILENVAKLCRCTQIVLAKKHTEADIKEFEFMYNRYNQTSKGLFNDARVLPNHHFALHIPQQMAYWGPLLAVSEFPGERMNGVLQKIKTNHRTSKCLIINVLRWVD